MAQTPLKNKINRFFFRNRDKGIPKLMLWIAVGNAAVYLLTLLNPVDRFYLMLDFNRAAILQGEVWRVITYPLCFLCENSLLWGAIGLFFYYWCGSILEQYWGTLRFNCYYLMGVLLTDAAALLLRVQDASIYYVNLSLFLAMATVMPEQEIRIYFLIPVKMKWLALIDLILTLIPVITGILYMFHAGFSGFPYLGWLLPIVALLNYVLFFGRQIGNLLPDFLRYHPKHKSWQRQVKSQGVYGDVRPRDTARFRCTVCGRTDVSNPELEFRFCSKCAGYRCYCEDHINNHVHLTE